MRPRRPRPVTARGRPAGTRPAVLVLLTGTGTDVGKTWWCAALARTLRAADVPVAVRKPVQSGEPGPPTDAELLAAASDDDADAVTPAHRTLPVAWAPPMAADALGLPTFTVAELLAETVWPAEVARGVGLVESVGGPRSPLAADGDTVTLAAGLQPDLVVVVADAGLGALNAVRLAAGVLDVHPVVVALNRFGRQPLHDRNLAWLRGDGYDVVTDPAKLAARLSAMLRRRPGATARVPDHADDAREGRVR